MKKALLIVFYLLFFIENPVFSQTSTTKFQHLSYDELKRQYFEVAKTDKEKRELADLYIKKGIRENNRIKIARGYYYTAILFYENDSKKAIQLLDSVIKYSKNNPDKGFPLSAYREKAYMLRKLYKYEEAIENYSLAEKLAKRTNLDFYYKIRLDIAELKSEELSQVEEALPIYIECYNYYRTKNTLNTDFNYCYNQTLFDLADAYISLNKFKLATFYNKLGYRNSTLIKDKETQNLFIFNEASNLISQKKYQLGIDSLKKALPVLLSNKNKANIMASYFFMGKAYEGLNNSGEALKNYIRVDSMHQKGDEIYPELIHGYDFIISHYKSTRNQKLELSYLNILMSINDFHQKKYRHLDKVIQKKYEIPQLLINKQKIIASLEGKNKTSFWIISVLILITVCLLLFLRYQKKSKIKYKERFEKIIAEYNSVNSENLEIEVKERKEEKNNDKNDISENVIEQVLQKLKQLENKKGYLDPEISLQSLSEKFETNTSYLSKIINEHKGKNFVQYINTLRIDYAIKILQEKPKLRNYSISALANEFGFKTSDSFSKAFFKQTGIKPSFFIKELTENKNTENQ